MTTTSGGDVRPPKKTKRPLLGTILFVLFIGPGPVIGVVPWLLSGWRLREPLGGWQGSRWIGGVLVVWGLLWLAAAISRFVIDGQGTPAPYAPTQKLVVTGPFRFVRNPMYVAITSAIVGEGLLFGSLVVVAYGFVAALAFECSVVFYEEPYLAKTFGVEFTNYSQNVRRWFPRVRPWRP